MIYKEEEAGRLLASAGLGRAFWRLDQRVRSEATGRIETISSAVSGYIKQISTKYPISWERVSASWTLLVSSDTRS